MTSQPVLYDIYSLAAEEDRCAPRTKLRISARLRGSGDRPFLVEVTDLSTAGFGCEAVCGLRSGASCWLTLPGLEALPAEVIWNNGTQLGCAFSHLLSQQVLDHILKRCGVQQAKASFELRW